MPTIILSTINARYIHASLGLRWLYANLGELQQETALQEYTLTDQITDMAEKILDTRPRVIGLAVYIWNAEQVRKLVGVLKRVAPDTIVVLGGAGGQSSAPAGGYERGGLPGSGRRRICLCQTLSKNSCGPATN